jgi:cytochrome c oxidase subunit 4
MASIKLYTAIFGVLMVLSTLQFLVERFMLEDLYMISMAIILLVSTIKAVSVAGWYMHVFDEPRAISYLAMGAVIGVLALIAGAAYSIT